MRSACPTRRATTSVVPASVTGKNTPGKQQNKEKNGGWAPGLGVVLGHNPLAAYREYRRAAARLIVASPLSRLRSGAEEAKRLLNAPGLGRFDGSQLMQMMPVPVNACVLRVDGMDLGFHRQ